MAKKKKVAIKRQKLFTEPDSYFFLKLVALLIVGSAWIFVEGDGRWQVPIPVGLILGIVLVTHEHFQIDRKIEYAILLVACFIAFWLPVGLVLSV